MLVWHLFMYFKLSFCLGILEVFVTGFFRWDFVGALFGGLVARFGLF